MQGLANSLLYFMSLSKVLSGHKAPFLTVKVVKSRPTEEISLLTPNHLLFLYF